MAYEMRISDWSSDVCSSDLTNEQLRIMSKENQWIVGINAVAAAVEHDAGNVREVPPEAGAKNPRIAEIETSARRKDIDVRPVAQNAIAGVACRLRPQGAATRYPRPHTWHEEALTGPSDTAP